jgi:hypothetical protein
MLCRLALLAWVAAFVLAAVQGCLADHGAAHDVLIAGTHHNHTDSKADALCAQHCSQAKSAMATTENSPQPHPSQWIVLLIFPLLLLPTLSSRSAPRGHFPRLFAPPDRAARLRFVRFND